MPLVRINPMFRFVPPAGSPLKINQVLHSMGVEMPSNRDAQERLQPIAGRLGVRHILGMCSGRAALWLALKSLQRLQPARDVVAVPAYTCFSVPAAIVRAGLKVYPVEIEPKSLDFDPAGLAALRDTKLLCIIPCNLFGFPNNISAVRKTAQESGAFVIDDAAQALGSTRDGRRAGVRGDVGIYSLGRGKSLGSVGGGLVVTDSDEIAEAIHSEAAALVDGLSATTGGMLLLKMFSYSLCIHPRLFWIPNSLPFLKLGTTEFEPSFTISKMHPLTAALLEQQLLEELDGINQIRRANAKAITSGLRGSCDFEVPTEEEDSKPTFVRLPVVARDRATRDRAVGLLRDAGIGAAPFYPAAICDIPGIERYKSERNLHCVHAEELGQQLFTLPVHPFVEPQDIRRMVDILATKVRE
jgi:perosamine synthetase